MKTKKSMISVLLTTFVIGLILLSGPASAVVVDFATAPNDANKGSDVSFTITVDINDPDNYLPVQYTNLIFTSPDGSTNTCKVYMDGSDDCDDVEVVLTNDMGYDYGYGYGYDNNNGYGYNFGYGYGYGYASSYGQITFDVVWSTPTALVDGVYYVQANVLAGEGATSHEFGSPQESFTISTATTTPATTGGNTDKTRPITVIATETEAKIPQEAGKLECGDGICYGETKESCPEDCGSEGETASETTKGMEGVTGAAITGDFFKTNTSKALAVAGVVVLLGLFSYFTIFKKKKIF